MALASQSGRDLDDPWQTVVQTSGEEPLSEPLVRKVIAEALAGLDSLRAWLLAGDLARPERRSTTMLTHNAKPLTFAACLNPATVSGLSFEQVARLAAANGIGRIEASIQQIVAYGPTRAADLLDELGIQVVAACGLLSDGPVLPHLLLAPSPTRRAVAHRRPRQAPHRSHGLERRSRSADGLHRETRHRIYSVTEGNNTRDARAIDDVWSKLYASCNDATALQALPDLCKNIANACTKYADAVEHAHNKAKWELAGAGVVVIGAGLFFTPETGGASDAGAAAADTPLAMSILGPIATALLGTVTLIAAGALAEHVIQAAENSADKAPNVQPNDADTQGLESSLEGAVKGDHDDIGAARVPDLNGKSLDEAERKLADQGFTLKNVTAGGYRHYSNPDGSEVAIRTDGEVIRLGPKIDPGPNQKNYKPRYGPDGLRTQQHSTGERVIFP